MSPASKKISWIISYDIASPKRLNRVHRYMKRRGIPLQYSVFLTRGTEAHIDRILDGLAEIINHRDDDVRAYPVPENPEIIWIGKRPMPDEVTFCLLPTLEDELTTRGVITETYDPATSNRGDDKEEDGGIILC